MNNERHSYRFKLTHCDVFYTAVIRVTAKSVFDVFHSFVQGNIFQGRSTSSDIPGHRLNLIINPRI